MNLSTIALLRSSTAINPPNGRGNYSKFQNTENPKRSESTPKKKTSRKPKPKGWIEYPPVFGIEAELESFDFSDPILEFPEKPGIVTRHFSKKYLSSYLDGYFRFGTLYGYANYEGTIQRLNDRTEGTSKEIYEFEEGEINDVTVEDRLRLGNVKILGSDKHIAISTIVNDYCACLSCGPYSEERAKKLINDGNQDIEAYVSYDRNALLQALKGEEELLLKLFGRETLFAAYPVLYGDKEDFFEISSSVRNLKSEEPQHRWEASAFTKPWRFGNEEEFRIISFRSNAAGRLPKSQDAVAIEFSRLIKGCIVASGLVETS
ncbi:hypothetical protein ILP92_07760 [Maribius pontilimi]|uniref:Uncharacterized protein n=1 Tax=Palleronia pontilimi TaxID=1964209 RepID=A0A934I931_9RHOB|nr:hypothetical protein [Palleronia pontilimi]MBJ3762638.1 hypothetical protein [Palleronia pontilimi]